MVEGGISQRTKIAKNTARSSTKLLEGKKNRKMDSSGKRGRSRKITVPFPHSVET